MRYVGTFHETRACGIGHRLLDAMQAVIVQEWYGMKYAHSPITKTTNPKAGEDEGAYWQQIDEFEYHLKLGLGEPLLSNRLLPLRKQHREVSGLSNVVEVWPHHFEFSPPRKFHLPNLPIERRVEVTQKAVEATPNNGVLVLRNSSRFLLPGHMIEYEEQGRIVPRGLNAKVRAWFQAKYQRAHVDWAGGKAHWRVGSYFSKDEFAIALAARYGGGLPRFDFWEERYKRDGMQLKYLPGQHFLHLMGKLRELYPDAHMILFTDGPRDRKEIKPLVDAGFEVIVCFEAYPSLYRVFHSFATADIVFDGNSGTGALGSYLGRGCVLMQPSQRCVNIGPSVRTDYHTGEFDADELQRAVQEYQERD